MVWHEEGHNLLFSHQVNTEAGLVRNGDVLFKKSSDGGNTFDKTVTLGNNTNASLSGYPRIAGVQ